MGCRGSPMLRVALVPAAGNLLWLALMKYWGGGRVSGGRGRGGLTGLQWWSTSGMGRMGNCHVTARISSSPGDGGREEGTMRGGNSDLKAVWIYGHSIFGVSLGLAALLVPSIIASYLEILDTISA